jgi:hypothetical protein
MPDIDRTRPRELAREQSLSDLEQVVADQEQLRGDQEQAGIDQAQLAIDGRRSLAVVGDEREGRILNDRQARIDRAQVTRDTGQESLDHSQEGRDHQQQALDETRIQFNLPASEQRKAPDTTTIESNAIKRAHASTQRAQAALTRARGAVARAEAATIRAQEEAASRL